MEIVLCTDINLISQATILLNSIIDCNKNEELNFHILTLDVKESDTKIFEALETKNTKISIYPIYDTDFSCLPIHMSYITKGTYLRFFIEKVLPKDLKKILYLDIDIIVCGRLKELWNEDLDRYSIAAAKDVECDDIRRYNRLNYANNDSYFNAGVLLINLSYWRKNKICERALKFLAECPEQCVFHDQDALNHILHGTIKFISNKYNAMYAFLKKDFENLLIKTETLSVIKNEIKKPIILHYAGKLKPWHYEYRDFNYPFWQTWQFFNKKSNNVCKLIHYKQKQQKNIKYWIKQLLVLLHLMVSEMERIREYFIDTNEIEREILDSISQGI